MKKIFISSFCVGCSKCLSVCPVNAIFGLLGSSYVISERYCVMCGKCITKCPIGCMFFYKNDITVSINKFVLKRFLNIEKNIAESFSYFLRSGKFFNLFLNGNSSYYLKNFF
ncbi:MAG TPA: 4Fe-4S binding protein [Candidatus Azoamicus sp. OHIO1]